MLTHHLTQFQIQLHMISYTYIHDINDDIYKYVYMQYEVFLYYCLADGFTYGFTDPLVV